jgi:antitoxin YefM
MDTWTAEEAQENLLKLIALVNESGGHFRITSENGSAVLLSEETYQNILVTLEVLSTPGLMNGLKVFQHPSSHSE